MSHVLEEPDDDVAFLFGESCRGVEAPRLVPPDGVHCCPAGLVHDLYVLRASVSRVWVTDNMAPYFEAVQKFCCRGRGDSEVSRNQSRRGFVAVVFIDHKEMECPHASFVEVHVAGRCFRHFPLNFPEPSERPHQHRNLFNDFSIKCPAVN